MKRLLTLLRLAGHDTARVVLAMPNVVLTALLILLVASALNVWLGKSLVLASWLLNLPVWFLLTHYCIVVHRFILLDETPLRFPFEPRDRLTWRFFGAWIALSILPTAVLVPMTIGSAALGAPWFVQILGMSLGLGAVIFSLRMTVLLPAIAVGSPGASWLNAYQDTKGHTVGIVSVLVVAMLLYSIGGLLLNLPIMLVGSVMGPQSGAARGLTGLLTIVLQDVLSVAGLTYLVAIASRMFQVIGDRIKHPLGPPVSA